MFDSFIFFSLGKKNRQKSSKSVKMSFDTFRHFLDGRFEYFLFFSARGRGRGSPKRQERAGVGLVLKIPGGGGGVPTRGGGGRGCLWVIWGRELNFFFRARNSGISKPMVW